MRIGIANLKGGVGKTTTAVHLAAALAARRGSGLVVLMDSDTSRSATGWAERGPGLPFVVRPATADADDADHVVVDAAAGETRDDLLALARVMDIMLIPAVPNALDLVTTLATVRLLSSVADVRVLLTRTPPAPQRDTDEARAMLTDAGVRVLTTAVPARKPYATAALDGVLVRDVRDRDAARLWAAWPAVLREMTA